MENFKQKNRVIRTATKGLKQAYDLQRNALTSLIHFVQYTTKRTRDVSALH